VQLAEEIRYLLLAAQREGNRALSEALVPLDLTPAQGEVLRVLQDYQPISLSELGGLLVCESGSPSRLVNGLVTTGLVQRDVSAHDRRYVTLTLTQDGEERATQVAAVAAVFHQQLEQLIQGVPIAEVMEMFWRYIENRPAGKALARRTGQNKRSKQTEESEAINGL
jgi:DNA-binding MarR family transcriptional regulator